MNNTTQYYDLASLAEASYVLFHVDGLDFSNGDQIIAALQNEQLYHGTFSATQAADFVSTCYAGVGPNQLTGMMQ